MASPDKSPVLNNLKEFDAERQLEQQAQSSTTQPEITVEENNENVKEQGDKDHPPKPPSAEGDLTRPTRKKTYGGIPKTSLSIEGDLTRPPMSWYTGIPKTPMAPSAWRTITGKKETETFDLYKEKEAVEIQLDRRERDLERQERELDRRSREIDRRERELERRQREFERDSPRWATEINTTPQWTTAIEALKNKIDAIVIKERINTEKREQELEARVMRKVNEALEREHQIMQLSDNEVNEMIEDTVGYLLQKDEDIADRVRFQSLVYLAQEKLATEAGLLPGPGLEPLPTVWVTTIGPSVVTEERYTKAMEILKKGYETFSSATIRLINCKPAMEFLVEYTSHLKKEGLEQSFAPGRIPREAYMESIERQVNQSGVNGEALTIVVDFVCQDLEKHAKPSQSAKPSEASGPGPQEVGTEPEVIKPSEASGSQEVGTEPEVTKPSETAGPQEVGLSSLR